MDIRIEKTKTALHNTFLELRSRKPLEKITIKELCEKAQINKSTFYSHYKDIYDLSDQLETEVVTSVIEAIPNPANCLEDPAVLAKKSVFSVISHVIALSVFYFPEPEPRTGAKSRISIKKKSCFESSPGVQTGSIRQCRAVLHGLWRLLCIFRKQTIRRCCRG